MSWLPLPTSTPKVEGDPELLIHSKLRSRELQNYRDIIVALPPSYSAGDRTWPVVVMHDGQNLFDPATSYAGDWGLRETLRGLAADAIEPIIVGIANKGPFRKYEYSPFRDPEHGGGDGERYLDFIEQAVLPLVRQSFRASTDPAETSIAGSSMGGLVSLYALLRRPETFGAAAALSPSAWFAGEALRTLVESGEAPRGRLWLDVGSGEGEQMVAAVRRLRTALVAGGLAEGDRFRYIEEPEATHDEAHWGRRFRAALPFLLGLESRARPRPAGLSDEPIIRP
jgi:predicted alpha/beta superfamily hydrolase